MTLTLADLASIAGIFALISGTMLRVVGLMIDRAILRCQIAHRCAPIGENNVS